MRDDETRQWERDEAAAAARLADVTAAKATTDRATKLEAEIAGVRAKLSGAGSDAVNEANPLGKALANIIGGAAATLTSWQQAIVAAVFELCLVGVMVIYELLGQRTLPLATQLPGGSLLRPSEPLRAASMPAALAPDPARKISLQAAPERPGTAVQRHSSRGTCFRPPRASGST